MRTRVRFIVTAALLGCSSSDEDAPPSSSSSGTTPTYTKDIAPILATSCALAACHSSKESSQFFYMTYDTDQIYTELLKTSPTCGTFKFVEPGQPEKSLLQIKIDGEQAKLPTDCASARRSPMPPGDPPTSSSDLLPLADRNLVRAWIKAGAKKD